MDKICAIIVTYNSMPWIDKCLQALEDSSDDIDYIIVDNNSSDETVTHISDHYTPFKIFENKKNLGFGKANNVGLNWALENGYDFFLLLNQDAYLGTDSKVIESLVTQLRENIDFGILSPFHFDGNGEKPDRLFEAHIMRSPTFKNGFDQKIHKDIVYEVSFVNAACWLLPRKTLEQVGLFHPLIFHYGEDDNYVHRLHAVGLKIGVVPSVRVLHDRIQTEESELKTNFNKSFKRELLVELLKPGLTPSFRDGLRIAKRITKSICWRKKQRVTIITLLNCLIRYSLIRIRVLWYNTLN